jgi:hypothetical protein
MVLTLITQSAQADFVCVAAISIAVAKGDDTGSSNPFKAHLCIRFLI